MTNPEMTAQDFVSFDDASFTYDGTSFVFRDLNLRVPQGQFLCLLGGNGSGKSTVAKCINALLTPDSGQVLTFGRSTADPESTYFIRSNAGLVFQNPDDQLVASLVENDVAFGPENLGVPSEELAQRVSNALMRVGLQGYEQRETAALSGGQKQRVAIAGILAMDPALLILDEASAMLDPRGREGLLQLCQELHQAGLTIIMITHFMEEAAQAQRVVVLDEGRIRLDGPPEEVLTHTEELRALSLDVPFAASLSLRLRRQGVTVAPCIHEKELITELTRLAKPERLTKDVEECETLEAIASLETVAEEAEGVLNEAEDPVLLSFQDVSFSYADPAREEQRRKQRRAQREQPSERANWGTDPEALWALRHILLDVHEGEFLGVAGHTGSGKSTLIQLMNRLLTPTEGQVLFRGQDLASKEAVQHVRGAVGLVFQYPEYQLFAATVYDDVAFGPRNQGLDETEVERRVRKALAQVGLDLEAVMRKSPFQLSGGQQRRVALAGVLAMEPQILVLDEPAAGLDPQGREELLDLIRTLHEQGFTCVMVSHAMEDLAKLADRILVLNEGSIFADGIPATVFADQDALHAIGLGVPAAQALALHLRQRGWPLKRKLYDEESLAEDLSRVLQEG